MGAEKGVASRFSGITSPNVACCLRPSLISWSASRRQSSPFLLPSIYIHKSPSRWGRVHKVPRILAQPSTVFHLFRISLKGTLALTALFQKLLRSPKILEIVSGLTFPYKDCVKWIFAIYVPKFTRVLLRSWLASSLIWVVAKNHDVRSAERRYFRPWSSQSYGAACFLESNVLNKVNKPQYDSMNSYKLMTHWEAWKWI